MDIKEAIKERHSVRQFKDLPVKSEDKEKLAALIKECNAESGLNIQLVTDDPECFDTFLAHSFARHPFCKNTDGEATGEGAARG